MRKLLTAFSLAFYIVSITAGEVSARVHYQQDDVRIDALARSRNAQLIQAHAKRVLLRNPVLESAVVADRSAAPSELAYLARGAQNIILVKVRVDGLVRGRETYMYDARTRELLGSTFEGLIPRHAR